ncbi:MAG: rubrerythrin [Bacteroidetes bacterium]|nr:rubrerythrin [Bacteroidota bacterium]
MKAFTSITDILQFAIGQEQEAVDFYLSLSGQAKSDDMKEVFNSFAKEEMTHKSRLTNILETGISDLPVEKIADLKIVDYLVKEEGDKSSMTYSDALILAMKKEKSAFKLYMALYERVSDPGMKQLFLSLAMEESKHKLRFELEYDDVVLREN